MAREKRYKETRKSYAIVGEGITEFFYFDANNPNAPYSRVFEVFDELMQIKS